MIAAAAPAYQVYARDLLASADFAALELDEVGALFKLLNYCWAEGDVSADPARVARVLHCKTQKAQALLPVLLEVRLPMDMRSRLAPEEHRGKQLANAFEVVPDEQGNPRIRSPYLEAYRAVNDEFRTSRSKAGKIGAEVRGRKPSNGADSGSAHDEQMPSSVSVSVSVSELQQNSVAKATGRAPDCGKVDGSWTDGQLMGLVRENLYGSDGRPPPDYDDGRDMNIIRDLQKTGRRRRPSIAMAIRGLGLMRSQGLLLARCGDSVKPVAPSEPVTLRFLYGRSGVRPLFDVAAELGAKGMANVSAAAVREAVARDLGIGSLSDLVRSLPP